MRVAASPSRGSTVDAGLGFDFDWGSIGTAVQQVAPAAVQLYAQKMQLDAQKKMAELQARAQAQAQQQAMFQAQQQGGGGFQSLFNPGQGRGAGVGDGLPSWVLPAAIGGAGLVLVLAMTRR